MSEEAKAGDGGEESSAESLTSESLQTYDEFKAEQVEHQAQVRQSVTDYLHAGEQFGQNRTLHAPSYQEAHFHYSRQTPSRHGQHTYHHGRHYGSRYANRNYARYYGGGSTVQDDGGHYGEKTFWQKVKEFFTLW